MVVVVVFVVVVVVVVVVIVFVDVFVRTVTMEVESCRPPLNREEGAAVSLTLFSVSYQLCEIER